MISLQRRCKKRHQNLRFSIRGAYFWKKEVRSLILMGFGQGYYARLSFTGQQYYKITQVSDLDFEVEFIA